MEDDSDDEYQGINFKVKKKRTADGEQISRQNSRQP